MAFDKTKPLTFNLPDGECNVITMEWLEAWMNDNIVPIITAEESTTETLSQISRRVDYWLEQQQPEE